MQTGLSISFCNLTEYEQQFMTFIKAFNLIHL